VSRAVVREQVKARSPASTTMSSPPSALVTWAASALARSINASLVSAAERAMTLTRETTSPGSVQGLDAERIGRAPVLGELELDDPPPPGATGAHLDGAKPDVLAHLVLEPRIEREAHATR